MTRFALSDAAAGAGVIGGAMGALTPPGATMAPVQRSVLDAVIARFGPPGTPSTAEVEPLTPEQVARWVPDPEDRRVLAHLVVALELMVHPLPRELEAHVEQYLAAVGVEVPYVSITRDTAREHLRRLHADLIRNSWYTEQTIEGIFHGHLGELVRSKLSYYAVGDDEHIARRWRALEDCPEGSWGHGVAEFYRVHGFPYPGEHHGIYEVGALHDWVHVLADYATDAEGEIDVFAFIAATMDDPRGFVQFIFTLALFQNASIDTVGGIRIPIARSDTLDGDGAADRLAESWWRASRCSADVMGGVDHFALADTPLEELRGRWGIVARELPGPGALDVTERRSVRVDLTGHRPTR